MPTDRREERRKFEGDVEYEVWRRGGDPNRINPDRLMDCFYEQHDAEACASRILKEQRQRRAEAQEEEE